MFDCQVVTSRIFLQMPSNHRCFAGHGRTEKPLMKAGAAHYRAKARGKLYPSVSGVAMNPVDHPHGGGNHQAVHGPNSVARTAPPGRRLDISPQAARDAAEERGRSDSEWHEKRRSCVHQRQHVVQHVSAARVYLSAARRNSPIVDSRLLNSRTPHVCS